MKKLILFWLLLQIAKISHSLRVTSIETTDVNKDTNINKETDINLTQINNRTDGRRQMNFKAFKKLLKGKPKPNPDHFYEPYVEGGQHVYLWSTERPPRLMLGKGQRITVEPTTPKYTNDLNAKNEMDIYRECVRECPSIYEIYYGPVCGFRLNTTSFRNEFQEFSNMCHLEYENCRWSQAPWLLAHRGPCAELTTFRPYPKNQWDMIERVNIWLNRDFDPVPKRVKKPKPK